MDELSCVMAMPMDYDGLRTDDASLRTDNVNDSEEQAEKLSSLIRGMLCHVNLIPVNVIHEGMYKKSSKQRLNAFKDVLERNKIPVSVRRALGNDIMA